MTVADPGDSTPRATRPTLGVVTLAPVTGEPDPTSGFSARNHEIVRRLAERADVTVFHLVAPGVDCGCGDDLSSTDVAVEHVVAASPVDGPIDRLRWAIRELVGSQRRRAWEGDVERGLAAVGARGAVVWGYPRTWPASRLAGLLPTLLLVEEQIRKPPTPGWRSRVRRAAGAIDRLAERRAFRPLECAAVISDREVPDARARFPHAEIEVIPLWIDLDYWQEEPSPEAVEAVKDELGPFVFVIGQMGRERNARGLRDVLDELTRRGTTPRVVVSSASAPHPLLEDVAYPSLTWLGEVDDPRPHYRAATATLVPSFLVQGMKTVVLQGWATGCPVVTTTPSSAAGGTTDGVGLLAGDTAADVAERLDRLLSDEGLAGRLVADGRRLLDERHGTQVLGASVDRALARAGIDLSSPATVVRTVAEAPTGTDPEGRGSAGAGLSS